MVIHLELKESVDACLPALCKLEDEEPLQIHPEVQVMECHRQVNRIFAKR